MPMTLGGSALQAQLNTERAHLSLTLNSDTSGGERLEDTAATHSFQVPQDWILPVLGRSAWAGVSSFESWSPPCKWSQASQWPPGPI